MQIIDAMGKPCPIPVIEAKKALAEVADAAVLVKVDNITAVQNLEKMATGYKYSFSYAEIAVDCYEVTICRNGKAAPVISTAGSADSSAGAPASSTAGSADNSAGTPVSSTAGSADNSASTPVSSPAGSADNSAGTPVSSSAGLPSLSPDSVASHSLTILITRDSLGTGAEDLGKLLIKGFIYSLTELPVPPRHVIFLNSGAFLTSADSNTIADLKTLEEQGAEILTCGTCTNYYELTDKLAVGTIANMFDITERICSSANTITI